MTIEPPHNQESCLEPQIDKFLKQLLVAWQFKESKHSKNASWYGNKSQTTNNGLRNSSFLGLMSANAPFDPILIQVGGF